MVVVILKAVRVLSNENFNPEVIRIAINIRQ